MKEGEREKHTQMIMSIVVGQNGKNIVAIVMPNGIRFLFFQHFAVVPVVFLHGIAIVMAKQFKCIVTSKKKTEKKQTSQSQIFSVCV